MSTDFVVLHCPYCGESFETAVDASAGDTQDYIEDCAVCCRPIVVHVAVGDDGDLAVRTRREDDSG